MATKKKSTKSKTGTRKVAGSGSAQKGKKKSGFAGTGSAANVGAKPRKRKTIGSTATAKKRSAKTDTISKARKINSKINSYEKQYAREASKDMRQILAGQINLLHDKLDELKKIRKTA